MYCNTRRSSRLINAMSIGARACVNKRVCSCDSICESAFFSRLFLSHSNPTRWSTQKYDVIESNVSAFPIHGKIRKFLFGFFSFALSLFRSFLSFGRPIAWQSDAKISAIITLACGWTEYVKVFCDIYYTLFSLINAKFRMSPQRVLWILLADLFCKRFELCDTENECIRIHNNWILLRSALHWMKSEETNETADTDQRISFTPEIFSYIYDLRDFFSVFFENVLFIRFESAFDLTTDFNSLSVTS